MNNVYIFHVNETCEVLNEQAYQLVASKLSASLPLGSHVIVLPPYMQLVVRPYTITEQVGDYTRHLTFGTLEEMLAYERDDLADKPTFIDKPD